MIIYYSDARCGGGKTKWAVEVMATRQTKWLYVVDRRDVFEDRIARLTSESNRTNTRPPVIRSIRSAHGLSEDDKGKASRNVRRDIEYLPIELEHVDHAVAFITHEAMRSADLSGFTGWSIIIDEVPAIFDAESVNTPASVYHFNRCYELSHLTGEWSTVKPVQGAVTMQEIASDEIMSGWAAFHRRATSKEGVAVALQSWEQMSEGPWQWFSIWSPLELSAFDNCYLLANSFTSTICYKLMRHFWSDEIDFRPLTIPSTDKWEHRSVTVRYFVDQHLAGTNFWKSTQGKQATKGWMEWIKSNSSNDSFWATNKWLAGSAPAGMPLLVSTKISGSNALRDRHEASVLYAAKPAPWERMLLRKFDIEPDDVVRSREYEDLIQILFRSSLRVPESTTDLVWNVYDKMQADFIADYLLTSGFNCDVSVVFEDIGINFEATSKATKVKLETPVQKAEKVATRKMTEAERKRAKRAAEKAAQEAAGTYRPRGRPKKKDA